MVNLQAIPSEETKQKDMVESKADEQLMLPYQRYSKVGQ